jgi:hypothetical protein
LTRTLATLPMQPAVPKGRILTLAQVSRATQLNYLGPELAKSTRHVGMAFAMCRFEGQGGPQPFALFLWAPELPAPQTVDTGPAPR